MARRLTDTEAMLWNLEQNPQLGSTMGAIATLEANPDPDRLRATVIRAISSVTALRECVRPSPVPLLPPEWVTDDQLDLDYHLRFIRLPTPASHASMIRTATGIINDPFDRTRPLWQLTVISGLPKGRAGMAMKLHHSIADGQGAIELAAHLLEFEPNAPAPDPIELAEVMDQFEPEADETSPTLADTIRVGAERVAGFLNDAASSFAHPGRTAEAGGDAVAAAKALAEQLPTNRSESSPLWRDRSRNRRFVSYQLLLETLKDAAKAHEVSLNDAYVVACAEAALRQHERAETELPTIAASVVISTRTESDGSAHNAFVPATISLPGTGASIEARLEAVRSQIIAKRAQLAESPQLLGTFGTIANLLPTSVAAALILDQTSRVDFATSNLPGPPVPVWFAGCAMESLSPVGPVAGTAFNATLLSYDNEAAIGLHIDPASISDPESLRGDLRDGLRRLGVKGLPR